MATHDYVIANGTGAAVRSDLNNALAAIVSNNSSSSEPATKYAYQWWADTTTGQLKLRNSANNAWVTIFELDGTMLMEDGSAAAPGLAFASDLDTGIAKNGTNGLMISAGGTQRFSVSATEVNVNDTGAATDFRVESDTNTAMLIVDGSANRVGIGAATPAATLDVAGNQIFTAADPQIQFNAGGPIIKLPAANTLAFLTDSSTERARLDSSGRLLVGLTSSIALGTDSYLAQIKATGASAGLGIIRTADSVAPPFFSLCKSRNDGIVQSGDGLGKIQWIAHDGNDYNNVSALINAEVDGTPGGDDVPGRLMFHTTADGASSPTERLRINSNGNVKLSGGEALFWDDAGDRYIACIGDTSSNINLHGRANVIFKTGGSSYDGGSERMRIRSGTTGGLILAGRTASVSANATLGIDTASGVAGIVSETGPTSGIDHIRFFNGNGNVGNITTSGGATAYNTSSDYRLKENVVDIADGITRVKQLSPKRFNFIVDADTTVDGFLAHEAQTVVPEAVTGTHDEVDSDGNPEYQGIDPSKLVPLLTAALQEAITKIETLETKVAALEAG